MLHYLGVIQFIIGFDKHAIVRRLYREKEFKLDIMQRDNVRVDTRSHVFFDELFDLNYGSSQRYENYESL